MKANLWKIFKQRIARQRASVCAWCRRVYDDRYIMADPLTAEQYAEVESHGICSECKKIELAAAKKKKGL